jgi:hypothetical protein
MISKTIRRVHMYMALFLVPWVLMYALSTMAMNHRPFLQKWYSHQPVRWELEREIPYTATFSNDAERWLVAEQILSDLKLEGSYRAQGRLDHQLTIVRNHAITPQRINLHPRSTDAQN